MADAKITDLPDGGDPQDTDDFVVARGVTNNKIAWSSMSNAIASGQVAIGASNTTYTSGTVVLTGAGGGVTVGSNAGQQAVISVAAPVAQTVQTQNVVDVTLSGNTAGALALISSGTMTLAGGNNITLSQAGNAITISGPNVGGAQTGISGFANSETTYTSGSVTLSELGAITIRSTTGQQFQFSVNPQSVQPETQTFIGGISASDTLYTSGSVRFTGSQAVTVRSGTGQLVVIDVPVQSTQIETQTFIAGVSASDTLYTSGNVRFTGVGGGVTVSSNTGQRVDISVAAPVPQTAQTGISGIANSQTTYTSGTVSLSELGAITIRSTTGNQYQFSVNSQSVQPETQTFLGGIGNSQVTYTSGTVNLSVEGGLMTIRSTTGQAFRFSVSQSVQPETQTFIGGIANSETTYTSGSVTLSALANITIRSTTGQQFQFSVPSGATATGNINAISNSNTTYTSGTIGLSELGAITIRSTTGNQFQFSVNAQTTQTQGILSAGVSTGGNTSGNTTVNTGSRLVFVGSNNITLSQGTAAGATTLTISGPATSAQQTGISGIANSQTTYTSGTVSLSELGAITIRSTTGNQYQFSVNAQTAQTGISGVANSQTTYTSGTVSLSELGAITIRSTTGNQYQFSVNSQTAQTQSLIQALYDGANSITTGTVRLTDANGVTFSLNAQTLSASVNQSISMFAVSNTTQSTSGTAHKSALSFGGAGGVSVGVTGGSVVISGGAGGAGMSAGLSNIGNTAGDTATVTGRLVLAGGNNITLSGSTNGGSMTITVSAPNLGAGAMSAGVSTGGNTAGSTGITGTQLVLVGTGPVSLSQSTGANGGTVSINAPATSSLSATGLVSLSTNGSTISVGVQSTSFSATGLASVALNANTLSIGVPVETAAAWENMPIMDAVLYTLLGGVSKTPFYWNENIPQGINPANIAFRVSMVTANSDLSLSAHFGVYTYVNSTSIALLGSASDAFHVSSGSSVSLSGQRQLVMTSPGTVAAISSLTPGNYVFGMMFSATNTNAMNASIYAASAAAGPRLGRIMPGTNNLSTGTSQGIAGLYGRGSTTVNALPANVQASEVVNQGIGASSPMKPHIFIRS